MVENLGWKPRGRRARRKDGGESGLATALEYELRVNACVEG